MNIIILGPQGSGKGTQAKLLADTLDGYYFESGEFARSIAKKDPRIAEIMKKGKLIPKDEMTNYVTDHLEKNFKDKNNIIIDGFPRFVSQYVVLEKWLEDRGERIDRVIFLEIPEEESIRRLSARRIDKKTGETYNLVTDPPPSEVKKSDLYQRNDDTPEAIKERLKNFRKNTLPMIKHIEKKGLLERVDGTRPIKEIHQEILGRLAIDAKN